MTGGRLGEIMFLSARLARCALASAIVAALSGEAFAQDDIQARPLAGQAFVVTDETGNVQRLRVGADGQVTIPSLPTA